MRKETIGKIKFGLVLCMAILLVFQIATLKHRNPQMTILVMSVIIVCNAINLALSSASKEEDKAQSLDSKTLDFQNLLLESASCIDSKYFKRAIARKRKTFLCPIRTITDYMYERANWEPTSMCGYDTGCIRIDPTTFKIYFDFNVFTDDDYEVGAEFVLSDKETEDFFQELDIICFENKGITFKNYIEDILKDSQAILEEEAVDNERLKNQSVEMQNMFSNCKNLTDEDILDMEEFKIKNSANDNDSNQSICEELEKNNKQRFSPKQFIGIALILIVIILLILYMGYVKEPTPSIPEEENQITEDVDSSYSNIDLSDFDASKVLDMSAMFQGISPELQEMLERLDEYKWVSAPIE